LNCLYHVTYFNLNDILKCRLVRKQNLTMFDQENIYSFFKFEDQNISKIKIKTNFNFKSKFRNYKNI